MVEYDSQGVRRWGWEEAEDKRLRCGIVIPPELALSREVGCMAKTLYMIALATRPGSISEIARVAGIDRGHACRVCAELAALGWMRMVRNGKEIMPAPVTPHTLEERRAKLLSNVVAMARYKGEFLMKCWLDLLVASSNLIDNARPGFLCNPMTGEALEFDRYYLEGAGFEYDGEQHYGPTDAYPSEDGFKQLRTRDLLKKGLSQERHIVLVEVRKHDLSLENMEMKIPDVLPRYVVDRDSPYVKALSRICQEYRAKAEG